MGSANGSRQNESPRNEDTQVLSPNPTKLLRTRDMEIETVLETQFVSTIGANKSNFWNQILIVKGPNRLAVNNNKGI